MEKFFLILLMIFLHHMGFAQASITDENKYKAAYKLIYQFDSIDVKSVRSEEMVLYLREKISRFSSMGTALRDSIMENLDRSDKSLEAFDRLRSQIPGTEFNYYVYNGIPTRRFGKDQKNEKDPLAVLERQGRSFGFKPGQREK